MSRGVPGRPPWAGAGALAGVLCLAASCLPSFEALAPFPCATNGECPSGFHCLQGVGCIRPTSCDPSAGHGACPTERAPKCTVVMLQNSERLVCLPPEDGGSLADGQPCQRSFPGNEGIGRDRCEPGYFCTGLEYTQLSRVCRPWCSTEAMCSTGYGCALFSRPPEGSAANLGLCLRRCTLFDSSCGTGRTCLPELAVDEDGGFGRCRGMRSVDAGAACPNGDSDCGPDMVCRQGASSAPATCRLMCDVTHPCPSSLRCLPFRPTFPNGAGLCVP